MDTIRFDELNLSPQILRAVTEMGFEEASPIQSKAIPVELTGRDVIGQAQTGTGKTAAFGIPLLEKIDPKEKKLQALVLCPTRELAIQVADEFRKLSKFMHGIKILPIYGGQDIVKQIRSLKAGTQIVIGTPGRVMDHMRRKTVKFDTVKTIILDEADEMLNMGFREDIETILEQIPQERQTILFSATMPKAILEIARKYQHDAETIKVVKKELTVPKIDQFYFEVKQKNKEEVLSRLLDIYAPKLSLVFCNTKRMVDELVSALQGRGYFAEGLHGDLKQSQRDRVMNSFRNGKTEILVATDVAARGIDVDDVEAVFNYDLPQDEEYYVHRIGRTGRAGRTGMAFSFVYGKEMYKLKDIQRYCKTKIKLMPVPSMDDVANTKIENIFEKVSNIIKEEDLSKMVEYIQNKLDVEDYTSLDLAAAFLKMELGVDNSDSDVEANEDFGDTGAEPGMVRLFINIGKKQNIRPGDILGAIAGESGMPGKLVGSIDMYDKYTFVEVPGEYARDVLKAMKNVKIKGKSVNIEPANHK
ncbi:MAG: DEAD/DEAH box helicase [Lachnospiraceae bacterium]|uniref:DEAD/DEAH box helicase n=1 Tax=Falcatimonas sp. MSJ-15 TaxID=2841515 RepID=UPI001C104DBA|nr:DEAD/DEAH box helicase [Falcatimonas sp. MSJ-15]MBQ5735867.1 DEAD/DEAH box helicase [Lachnospiraceae bacterium]MBU5471107.1 DEAD/DEAH box helicase [Falcatimonas sp. MSJ-15]MEE0959989.1 DEAD/DEAH box helicase [Lachnospiraceae bacterium]